MQDEHVVVARYRKTLMWLDFTDRTSRNYEFLLGMKEAFEVCLQIKTFEDIERLKNT